jgi:hypothetical protein
MANLCLTNQDMLDRLLEYMIATDYDAAGTTQKADALDLLNDGFRRFLRGGYADELQANTVHRWSFLEPVASFDTTADQSTFDLPAGFGGLVDEPVYDFSGTTVGPDLQRVSPETIRQMWRDTNTTDQPSYYAVEPKAFDGTTGQRWQLLLAPVPDAVYAISYRYSLIVDALEDDTKFPPGGAMYCDVILQAALAAAERTSGDVAGHHEQLYQMMLREAIARDATTMNEVQVEQLTDVDAGM